MNLSEGELKEFVETGVLFFSELFSVKELLFLRAAANRVTERPGSNVTPETKTSGIRMVHGAHKYEDVFSKLCQHPRIVRPAEQLLGTGIYLHQTRLNVNQGFGSGGFDWHQDYATWKEVDGLPEPRALMIAVFFDEVDATNGPLLYIPGSHSLGVIDDFEPIEDATGNVLMNLSRAKLTELAEENGIKAGIGNAGSVLFMHCNLVHGSTANISPKSRTLFYINVNSVENPQTAFVRADYHAGSDFTPLSVLGDDVFLK